MVKKLSTIALAGLLALPATALAADIDELEEKVDQLSVIQLSGDFRSRLDNYSVEMINQGDMENSTLMTNRLRLNIRAKATENVEFKGRLAYYKAWGMQSVPTGVGSFNSFVIDGNDTRQPNDSALHVDRAFMNWNNIGDMPLWFSIGRRPTTDGPPAHLKLNNDKRMATPTAFMDWPFDGISIGYAYSNTARIRFCWGRGFEDGLLVDNAALDDTDFAGLSWDVHKKGNKLIYLQSFMAFRVFNYPDSADGSLEAYMSSIGNPQSNLGNILHTSGVYMDKISDINYFVSFGHSQTMPDGNSMMLGTTDEENGYSVHVGGRYDLDDMGLKLGVEYNFGSENWIGMTPGNDDMYQSKLATRGSVIEAYMIYDLPSGEAVSKYGKAFIRLGYQHYMYDYTGSGDWNMPALDVDAATTPAMLAGMNADAPKDADQIYVTMEMYF